MKYTLLVNGDLYHSALLLSALAAYRSPGKTISVVSSRSITPWAPRLVTGDKTLAFDLRDQSYSLCLNTLEQVDVYFKRSYYEPHLHPIPETLRRKIKPFGLNYSFKTSGSNALVAGLFLRQPVSALQYRDALRTYLRLAEVSSFELLPSESAELLVYFQTRVWEPEEVAGDDYREINETRVALIQQLRKAFGVRFKGGLIPTPFAQTHFPDEISTEPHIRSQYAKSSRLALIGIYTRGLHHSHAFKLPEYLAASKCIVGEPLRNGLAMPLEEGLNYLPFVTVSDCLALCDRLLSNTNLCNEMRAANWDYYTRYVRFDRRMPAWLQASGMP